MENLILVVIALCIIFIATIVIIFLEFFLENWALLIGVIALLITAFFLYTYVFSKGGGHARIINDAP